MSMIFITNFERERGVTIMNKSKQKGGESSGKEDLQSIGIADFTLPVNHKQLIYTVSITS